MTRVVCVGECMVELTARPDGAYARAFAGDAYNTALHIKRCAPEIDVQFLTVTGQDSLSEAMRRAWRDEQVDGTLSPAAAAAFPGLYLAETDVKGERAFTYWRSQSAARRWGSAFEAAADQVAGADILFITGVSLAILSPGRRSRALDLVRRLKSKIGAFAFDPNIRPVLWESAQAMRRDCGAAMQEASILLPSLPDLEQLWGPAPAEAHLRRCIELGASEVVLTLGQSGCMVAQADGAAERIGAPKVRVVDTSGAGDAFNGAYLAARLQGEAPAAAASAGLALSARVVGHRGALTGTSRGGSVS